MSPKHRAKNWSTEEAIVLVENITKRKNLLIGNLKIDHISHYDRECAWQEVVDAVNAVSPVDRSLQEIKKKFKDLKTRTKQKITEVKKGNSKIKTKGTTPFDAVTNKIIQFIETEVNKDEVEQTGSFIFQGINTNTPSTLTCATVKTETSDESPLEDSIHYEAEEDVKESPNIQEQTNSLLKELIDEFRISNELKKREVDLLEQMVQIKKQRKLQ